MSPRPLINLSAPILVADYSTRYLTVNEYAGLYRVSLDRVRRAIKLGLIQQFDIGGNNLRVVNPGWEAAMATFDPGWLAERAYFLRRTDVGAICGGASKRTVRDWEKAGHLRGRIIEGTKYFSLLEVRQQLERQRKWLKKQTKNGGRVPAGVRWANDRLQVPHPAMEAIAAGKSPLDPSVFERALAMRPLSRRGRSPSRPAPPAPGFPR